MHRVPIYVSPISIIFVFIIGAMFEPIARDRLTGESTNQTYGLAALIAIVTMISIVLHELGHALVAQRLRFEVDAITIYGFVGVTQFRPEPETPGRSFLVSFAGPMVNLIIGVPAWIAYSTMNPNSAAGLIVFSLAWTNAALGFFNLLPGLPLDGGAVFASGVWKVTGDRNKSIRAGAYSGFVVAAALAVWGFRQYQQGATGFTIAIAIFLALSAGAVLKRSQVVEKVPDLVAGGIARRAVTVDANLPLSEALRRAEAARATAVVVADSSGRPWALMNGAAADAVPPDRRPWTTINQVSRPLEDGLRIPDTLSGQELMERLNATPASEYAVYNAEGAITGVLVTVDVVARIDPAAANRLATRR